MKKWAALRVARPFDHSLMVQYTTARDFIERLDQNGLFVTDDIMLDVQRDFRIPISHSV